VLVSSYGPWHKHRLASALASLTFLHIYESINPLLHQSLNRKYLTKRTAGF